MNKTIMKTEGYKPAANQRGYQPGSNSNNNMPLPPTTGSDAYKSRTNQTINNGDVKK